MVSYFFHLAYLQQFTYLHTHIQTLLCEHYSLRCKTLFCVII